MDFKNALWVFFISMLPLVELRGAVPVGAILELPWYINAAAAIIGNLLPIPFILLFIPKILDFLNRFKIFRPIVEWLRKKANKNAKKISDHAAGEDEAQADGVRRMPTGAFLGLLLFVLLPVPGTGAWTGSLVAALFNFEKRKSFLAIVLGVIGCAVIMMLASYGVLGFLSFLL